MIVCVCEGISDRAIREVARVGARTVADIREKLGATSCGHCGSCCRAIRDIVREERPMQVSSNAPAVVASSKRTR